uniref:BCR activator of RhoGEF and GTPase n=1 Tax=Poecilia reticulata TaxID=8081 RepID=A0A3P9PQJ0_POERE
MVEPLGFVEAWRAQFPESDPPKMDLGSLGHIEQELDKCKSSIRHLEKEVNKERFRMIYLQTLLAKERKSYDGQRWGFKKMPSTNDRDLSSGGSENRRSYTEEALTDEQKQRGSCKTQRNTGHPEEVVDGLCLAKQKERMSPVRQDSEPPDFPVGTGSVAALRSNFERIRRANSHTAGDSKGLSVIVSQDKPFYVNMEYHHERGLVRVNDKEVSDKISTLGSQAMQMERKRSLHSLPGNLSAAAGDLAKPVQRGRSTEGSFNGSPDDPEVSPHFLTDGAIRSAEGRSDRQPVECQPYTSVYVGGMMGEGDTRVIHIRDRSMDEDPHLTWPRRSYSPGSFDDVGGGYTPDCSSNENLTSSEEDFSSGQSSQVSPSPTTYPMFREKSRSPSQYSQLSIDSGSPPTPLSQKCLKQHGVPSIVGVRKRGHMWPSDGDSTTSNMENPPSYGYDLEHSEEHPPRHETLSFSGSPSSSPRLRSKNRNSRDTQSSGSLESTQSVELEQEKGQEMRKWVLSGILASEETYLSHLEALLIPMKPLKAAATTSQPMLTIQEIETIFFNVPELHEIHKDFYDALLPRVQDWSHQQCVGDLFQKLVHWFGFDFTTPESVVLLS